MCVCVGGGGGGSQALPPQSSHLLPEEATGNPVPASDTQCSIPYQFIVIARSLICMYMHLQVSVLCPVILLHLVTFVPREALATSSCSELRNYTVSSSGVNSSECLSGDASVPCKTLEYLGPQIHDCARVTVLDHTTLWSSVELSSLVNVSIVGNMASPLNVSCKNSSGFIASSAKNLHLEGLRFVSCSAKCPHDNSGIYSLVDYASLCVYQGENISISDCVFRNSKGTGVIMHDVVGNNQVVNTNFTQNSRVSVPGSTSGGLIIKRRYVVGVAVYTISGCWFTQNENHQIHNIQDLGLGGGLHFHLGAKSIENHLHINGSRFASNRAISGGAIQVNKSGDDSSLNVSVQYCLFESNVAKYEGGGLWLTDRGASPSFSHLQITNSNFTKNHASWGGGMAVYNGTVTIEATQSYWSGNRGKEAAYAVAIDGSGYSVADKLNKLPDTKTVYSFMTKFTDCHFLDNTDAGNQIGLNSTGAVQIRYSSVKFMSCTFTSNAETALDLRNFAYASFAGNTTFTNNTGIRGGAIYVDGKSVMELIENVVLHFEHNSAIIEGGAIYAQAIKTDSSSSRHICVFDSLQTLLESEASYKVEFSNNTASGKYQSIYVGSSKDCLNSSNNGSVLLNNSKIFTYESNQSGQFISFPLTLDLDFSPKSDDGCRLEVMLGEKFYLIPTAKDIFSNIAYLTVNLALVYRSGSNRVKILENLDLVSPRKVSMDNFTHLNPLYIKGKEEYVGRNNLYLEVLFEQEGSYHLKYEELQVELVNCRTGFVYRDQTEICECIKDSNLVCDTNNSYACVRYGYWFGDFNQTDGKTLPCFSEHCKYADGKCPTSLNCSGFSDNFCRLVDPDDLCWDNRSGIMCSNCKQDYAFTFHALRCANATTCTAPNTALLTLGIVLAWVFIIVFVLAILNVDLSIGLGFMYGIVYYFSVIPLFTEVTITSSILETIIYSCVSVTQLNPRAFGDILVCFAKSWDLNLHHLLFQYATPVFVITTVIVIIFVSRYCRCPKAISLAENSPIHAICILVLFSYTSLTYTSFEMLKSIKIKEERWVYQDPDIKFFGSEHTPYALVALFFECAISLPICFLLLFAPCLSKKVNVVKLRLKPILDDFQACYRPECRWFAGFYFLARQLLFLANIVPLTPLPQDNHIFHFLNLVILLIHSTIQPYKFKWLNFLDTLLLFDVLILSLFTSTNTAHKVLSFLLILPPAIYLTTIIFLIAVWRVFNCLRSYKTFQAIFRRRNTTVELSPPLSGASDKKQDDDKSRHFYDSDFFKDCEEREPLLSETDSSPSSYSSGRRTEGASRTFTTSSLRVSTLSHFPPQPDKSSTS